ncbi:ras GEF [Venturia nashicola]|nr:ras GEF [Venturia nashicola]
MAKPRLSKPAADSSSPDQPRVSSLSRPSPLASQRSDNAEVEAAQRRAEPGLKQAAESNEADDLTVPVPARIRNNPKRNSPTDTHPSVGRGSYGQTPLGPYVLHLCHLVCVIVTVEADSVHHCRPVVRPGNQRSQPTASHSPIAVLPDTRPRTSGPDADSQLRPTSTNPRDTWFSSSFATPKSQRRQSKSKDKEASSFVPSPKRGPRKRSHSFSTVTEHTLRPRSEHQGTFKVVIHRPATASSRTAESNAQNNVQLPILEVPIPHYRLGTPQFAAEGRAILRSSLYTRSGSTREEARSSDASNAGYDKILRTQTIRSSMASRRHSEAFPRPLFHRKSTVEVVSTRSSLPAQSEARQSIVAVAPKIYDALTLNPDDPTVVRYAPNSDKIVAATPSRLVAHITSPSFLDYELLSDFFLTFRAFMQPDELVSFLVTRLRWAVDRPDDSGRIVRVRTFVALRHWILNYFLDDLVPDYELRRHFCELVNGVYEYLRNRPYGGAGDIKILGELKKCWRRTCALHWESADPFAQQSPDDDIVPGGPAGSNVSDQSSIQPAMTTVAQMRPPDFATPVSYCTKPLEARAFGIQKPPQHAPQPSSVSAPFSVQYSARPETGRTAPLSPQSPESATFLSCSLPIRPMYRFDEAGRTPLVSRAGPTPASRISPCPTIARTPHPLQSHNNLSESPFDFSKPSQRCPSLPDNPSEFQVPAMYTIPGSLVRGVLYQPGSPYFDVKSAGSVRLAKLKPQLTVEFVEPDGPAAPNSAPNSGPGVKKFLGSVRRALSNKYGLGLSDQCLHHPGDGHLRSTASFPEITQEKPFPRKSSQRSRPQVRIDMLYASVIESFKGAVEAGMQEDRAMERDILAITKQVQHDDGDTPKSGRQMNRFDRSVTVGSRSIVIVDDTQPDLSMPMMMSGAINPPGSSPSSIAIFEGYVNDAYERNHEERAAESSDERARQSHGKVPTRTISNAKDPSGSARAYEPTGLRKASLCERRKQATVEAHSPPKRFTMTSTASGGSTLRRYVSYHSGDSRPKSQEDEGVEVNGQGSQLKPSDSDEFILGRPPGRQLRRRPGGDLKATNMVHGLEEPHRPTSTGSISSVSPSYRDSFGPSTSLLSAVQSQDMKMRTPIIPSLPSSTPKRQRDQSGQVPSPSSPKRRSISLIQTHSSQPNLRPSFEAEVAKLAALPDDVEDDGGVEAALLKLEGRYEKKTPQASPVAGSFVASPTKSSHMAQTTDTDWLPSEDGEERRVRHHKQHVEEVHPVAPLPSPSLEPENIQTTSIHHLSTSTADLGLTRFSSRRPDLSQSVAESEDSYSSVPLLERGFSGVSTRQRTEKMHTREDRSEQSGKEVFEPKHSASSSIEHIVETDSLRRIPQGGTLPRPRSPTMHKSFLLDDTQEFSENYGTYMQSDTDSQGVESFFDDEIIEGGPDTSMFSHPLRHPETPPISRKLSTPPQQAPTTTFNEGLPTPGVTPTTKFPLQPPDTAPRSPVSPARRHLRRPSEPIPKKAYQMAHSSVHLPFILGFDAEVIAQQFTIIEKDALDEIDWKELIELRWKQTSPAVHDWVEYLRTQDPRGVDLAIARFNVIVKWVVSEIVLTENPDERVKTIVHCIHIAAHCRRYRNYASMYQITIALLSADCSRLKKTWENVPVVDRSTFSDLEKLVQPLKNFHSLRAEMEMGTGDEGCIPFIGIYTRDLVYNAQKPPHITSPPQNTNEPLVNFERHQTAASIVKSLLRLLEASSKYQFEIVPQVIDKCLWVAALDDDEITRRSKALE